MIGRPAGCRCPSYRDTDQPLSLAASSLEPFDRSDDAAVAGLGSFRSLNAQYKPSPLAVGEATEESAGGGLRLERLHEILGQHNFARLLVKL